MAVQLLVDFTEHDGTLSADMKVMTDEEGCYSKEYYVTRAEGFRVCLSTYHRLYADLDRVCNEIDRIRERSDEHNTHVVKPLEASAHRLEAMINALFTYMGEQFADLPEYQYEFPRNDWQLIHAIAHSLDRVVHSGRNSDPECN